MRAWKHKSGEEAFALIGDRFLNARIAKGFKGIGAMSVPIGDWIKEHCTEIPEEEFKAYVQPILDELRAVMGGAVGIDLMRKLRAAQKEYYAYKFPDKLKKNELLKAARHWEDQVDKLLRRMEPPEFPPASVNQTDMFTEMATDQAPIPDHPQPVQNE